MHSQILPARSLGKLDPGLGFLLWCQSKWAEAQKWRAYGLLSLLLTLKIIISHLSVFFHVFRGSTSHWKLITQKGKQGCVNSGVRFSQAEKKRWDHYQLPEQQLPVNMQRLIKQHVKRYYWMALSLAPLENQQSSKPNLMYWEFVCFNARKKKLCVLFLKIWRDWLKPFPRDTKGSFG